MHELSFGTWLIHISSVIEWIFAIFVINKISTYKKYNLFFWLSLAMVPNLIGAMCAITWHIYDNQENLYGLVSLQGIFTFIGNSTLALAAIKIFKEKRLMNDLFFKFIEKLGSIDNTLLFAVSIIPYAIFLFYLYKIKSVNIFVKTGFSLTVLFVFITILVSIFTLNYYDKTLVEVDFLHGFAESFLTLSDFVILFGFIKLLNSLEVNNS